MMGNSTGEIENTEISNGFNGSTSVQESVVVTPEVVHDMNASGELVSVENGSDIVSGSGNAVGVEVNSGGDSEVGGEDGSSECSNDEIEPEVLEYLQKMMLGGEDAYEGASALGFMNALGLEMKSDEDNE
uniref:Uncharacterized protein n=1 Tax=Timspurckia oligopyrenoides TaxID=708627 RepID=A0A7S1ETC1_9RHOD|mmetsp:Transcript_5886/g.10444  ORF Transcript_5886/g.10444 Transcript_5886/m.10444 type:complete len:130 (+) Transcript_5886:219-608(+)